MSDNTLETIAYVIEALRKQIPLAPVKMTSDGIRYTDNYKCPACLGGFSGTGIADYCYHCGQKLSWESTEGE